MGLNILGCQFVTPYHLPLGRDGGGGGGGWPSPQIGIFYPVNLQHSSF